MRKFLVTNVFLLLCFTFQAASAVVGAPDGPPDRAGWTEGNALKAILVVGPQEDGTVDAMERMDRVAEFLHGQGVQVRRFYDDRAVWEDITAISHRANIFIYSGHGGSRGPNGTGGLTLTSSVHTAMLLEEFKLAPNALVLFQSVCRGAGSSADDDGDIGMEEAGKRVVEYAWPFFDVGAAGYFASNYHDGCLDFLRDFFGGKTLGECYLASVDPWCTVEFSRPFPERAGRTVSVASHPGGGMATRTSYANGVKTKVEQFISPKDYPIAYAGLAGFSIGDLRADGR